MAAHPPAGHRTATPWPLWIALSILLLPALPATAQTSARKELEDKRRQILNEIKKKNTQLEKTREKKNTALRQQQKLQTNLEKKDKVIGNLQATVAVLDKSINRTEDAISSLREDVGKISEEYGHMARQMFRQHLQAPSPLGWLLSAPTLNQAFQRWYYLRRYDQYRLRQARYILDTQRSLSSKMTSLTHKKEGTAETLHSEVEHKQEIKQELRQTSEQVQSLSVAENKLTRELEEHRKAHEKLNLAIEAVIREEMTKRLAAARRRPEKMTSTGKSTERRTVTTAETLTETPEFAALSADFKGNKGKLPWPVEKGAISRLFGVHPHPEAKNIQVHNNGIDITTSKNTPVRSVFKGKVVGVQFVPGCNNVVIVQHGNYYTVYSNLEQVNVRAGDNIQTKQTLGKVANNMIDNKTDVHFEVWLEKKRMNPSEWIAR